MTIKRSTISAAILCIALLAASAYLAPRIIEQLLHLDNYKTEIIANLEQGMSRKVLYEKGEFTLRRGPAFSLQNIVIKEKDGASDFITARKISLRLSLLKLLQGQIVITDLALDAPNVRLTRSRAGELNIADLLASGNRDSSARIEDIWLTGATIRLTDAAAVPESLDTTLTNAELVIEGMTRGEKSQAKLTGTLLTDATRSPVTIGGSFRMPKPGKPLSSTDLNLKLHARNLQPAFFWPYYAGYVPFRKFDGTFDLDLSLKGTLNNFASSGDIRINRLRFDYPQVFHALLTPKSVALKYDLTRTPSAVKIKSVSLAVDDVRFKGSCSILDLDTKDPRITAQATSAPFQLEPYRGFIPYGIIVKDTADFIEQHIMGGVFRLEEGSLDGRISQILHMEKDKNYNILYIKARVDQGLVTYGGPSVPTFNSISGTLEMKGKDFVLSGMQAKFGSSPFTMDGKITDYPIDVPSHYPFTMEMTPQKPEIAWLMGQTWGKQLVYSGVSKLHLTGSGGTARYAISGEWDLAGAAYSFKDYIKKPAGKANSASFTGFITKSDMQLTSLRYSLAPLVLAVAATYRYTGAEWLGIDLKTNRFPVHEVTPMIPLATAYQPTGQLMTALQGRSAIGKPLDLGWGGTISMAGGAIKPGGDIRPVSAINGTISFSGKKMETSHLAVRLGSSLIQGKGSLTDLDNPAIKLSFSAPLFDPADVGLTSPDPGLRITNLSGSISLKEQTLQIESVSAKVNKTDFTVKGVLRDFKTRPDAEITVTGKHLELDDILLLTALEAKGTAANIPPPTVRAGFTADSVRAIDMPFTSVKGSMLLKNGIVEVKPVLANLADGRLAATVTVDTSQPGKPNEIRVGCILESASADAMLNILGLKRQEMRGRFDLRGDITARGSSAAEVKQTINGKANLIVHEGTLNRFSSLSKAFSILNVSQLLKFKLPDLKTEGMPFNLVTGTCTIKDGIIHTNDLFLDSTAANVSFVGTYDLYKDRLDMTLGVKPLQTLDKVVSSIPIVGWVLTGRERAFVSAYFEVKGELGNPSVKSIQLKSMSKGTIDIFSRLFQLPARIFTDTGEVIIGK